MAVSGFASSCAQALCAEGAALANLDDPLKSAFLGQFTGFVGAAFASLSKQPRYMIELLTALPPQSPPPPAGQAVRNFRITAKGYGVNSNTVVVLQTVYQMTL